MAREPETKENTEALEEKLVARLRDWLQRVGKTVHSSNHGNQSAELKFTIFTSETQYLDDDTPYLEAHVTEKLRADELGGWIGEAAPKDVEPSGE